MDPNKFIAENESKKDYPIGLTVHETDADSAWVKALDEVLHSEEYQTWFNETYQGTLVLY